MPLFSLCSQGLYRITPLSEPSDLLYHNGFPVEYTKTDLYYCILTIIKETIGNKGYFQKLNMEVSPGSTCFNSSPTDTKQKKVIRNTDNSHTGSGLSLIFVGPTAKVQEEDYNPPLFFAHSASPICSTLQGVSAIWMQGTLISSSSTPPPHHRQLLNNLPLAVWHGGHGLPWRGYSENGAHVGPRGGPRTFEKRSRHMVEMKHQEAHLLGPKVCSHHGNSCGQTRARLEASEIEPPKAEVPASEV